MIPEVRLPYGSDPAAIYVWAEAILEVASYALTFSDAPAPAHKVIYNGGLEVAFDNCREGQLWVAYGRIYPSDWSRTLFGDFPSPTYQPSRDCPTAWALDYEVGIVRCSPQMDTKGKPPSDEAIQASAKLMMTEQYLLMRAMREVIEQAERQSIRGVLTEGVPAGDEGECVGSIARLTVEIGRCDTFDDFTVTPPLL
jgi:hypothetical protein